MDLLDRYLQAVKKHLPWQKQEDIIAELRANLESQLEDREAGLGRPLTQAEAEAWLKEMGPPMHVAARYKLHQYLIGPELFPIYWFVMRMAGLCALLVYSILCVVQSFAGDAVTPAMVVEMVLRVPVVLLSVATWVTLAFVVLETAMMHGLIPSPLQKAVGADWSPRTLPALERDAAGKRGGSYAQAVAHVIFGFLFLIWLSLIPKHPAVLFGPGVFYMHISHFQLAPVWTSFYWWVVALNVLQLAWRCWDLWSGNWQRPRSVQEIVIKAIGLAPMVILLNAPDHIWVTLKQPIVDQVQYGAAVEAINHWGYRGVLMVIAIASLQMVFDLGRLILDGCRKRPAVGARS